MNRPRPCPSACGPRLRWPMLASALVGTEDQYNSPEVAQAESCRLPKAAHLVISLLRSNLVVSGVKRTSITEGDL
jgi:hypothetical protein